MEGFTNKLKANLGVLRDMRNIMFDSLIHYVNTAERVLRKGEKHAQDPEFTIDDVLNGDRADLSQAIEVEIKKFYVSILNAAEVSAKDDRAFSILRGRILSGGNDTIRDLNKKLEAYFVLRLLDQNTVDYK